MSNFDLIKSHQKNGKKYSCVIDDNRGVAVFSPITADICEFSRSVVSDLVSAGSEAVTNHIGECELDSVVVRVVKADNTPSDAMGIRLRLRYRKKSDGELRSFANDAQVEITLNGEYPLSVLEAIGVFGGITVEDIKPYL